MDNTNTLHGKEAIDKLKEITGHAPTCHFLSLLNARPIPARPMRTMQVDAQGLFWFIGSVRSELAEELGQSNDVQLLYAEPDEAEYLTVFGKASVVRDEGKMAELRSSLDAEVDSVWAVLKDSDQCLIKVEPRDIHYRDAKSGKGESLVNMMVAGVFGREGNEAVQGRIIPPRP